VQRTTITAATVLLLLASACGGPQTAGPSTAPPVAGSTTTVSSSDSPTTKPPADDEEEDLDPNESAVHLDMTVTLPTKPSFPKATSTEEACWKDIELTGKHKKDYATIIDRCGTPTGLVEYAAPVLGRIHHTKDKRDSFKLKLKGGYCYRYFAAADDTVEDIDILVETTSGALVADDKTKSPVAIIEATKSWCQSADIEYVFHIEVDGPGKGGYTFGVWARPK
jgi:hypothetical protein